MRIEWSATAQVDLNAVVDYINVDNPDAARAVLRAIRDRANHLATYPRLGHPGRQPGTREQVIIGYPYTLIYSITGDTVTIARVLHQRQQWPLDDA